MTTDTSTAGGVGEIRKREERRSGVTGDEPEVLASEVGEIALVVMSSLAGAQCRTFGADESNAVSRKPNAAPKAES